MDGSERTLHPVTVPTASVFTDLLVPEFERLDEDAVSKVGHGLLSVEVDDADATVARLGLRGRTTSNRTERKLKLDLKLGLLGLAGGLTLSEPLIEPVRVSHIHLSLPCYTFIIANSRDPLNLFLQKIGQGLGTRILAIQLENDSQVEKLLIRLLALVSVVLPIRLH